MTASTRLAANLICLQCDLQFDYQNPFQSCQQCGSDWLDVVFDGGRVIGTDWIGDEHNLWRYFDLLPLENRDNIVSLHEGWTPLLRSGYLERELNHRPIYIKYDGRNPTGSFKARQASLMTSVFKERNMDGFVACSTGNVAMAYAAYCARAKLRFTAFLPASVPRVKEEFIRSCGAHVVRVDAGYDEARRQAKQYARDRGLFYDSGADCLVNRESKKTIAFELAEQLDWRAPDWYVQALNGGPGPMGVWKGFRELLRFGLIDKMPRIACIQTVQCSPMVDSYNQQLPVAQHVQPTTKIATLSYGQPGFSYVVLSRRIADCDGLMAKVDEDQALARLRKMARHDGQLHAPAAAVAIEGACQLIRQGAIGNAETVVINSTADGIYAHELIFEGSRTPPT